MHGWGVVHQDVVSVGDFGVFGAETMVAAGDDNVPLVSKEFAGVPVPEGGFFGSIPDATEAEEVVDASFAHYPHWRSADLVFGQGFGHWAARDNLCNNHHFDDGDNFLSGYDSGDEVDEAEYDQDLEFWFGNSVPPHIMRALCNSAVHGEPEKFARRFADAVLCFSAPQATVFLAGECLSRPGVVDEGQRTIFGHIANIFGHIAKFDFCMLAAKKAMDSYQSQLRLVRQQVCLWNMIARRHKIIWDLRTRVSRLIWDSRYDCFVSSTADWSCSQFAVVLQKPEDLQTPAILSHECFFSSVPVADDFQHDEEDEEEEDEADMFPTLLDNLSLGRDHFSPVQIPFLSEMQKLSLQQWYQVRDNFVSKRLGLGDCVYLAERFRDTSADCAWFAKKFSKYTRQSYPDFKNFSFHPDDLFNFALIDRDEDFRVFGLVGARFRRLDFLVKAAKIGRDPFSIAWMLASNESPGRLEPDKEALMLHAAVCLERDAVAYFGRVLSHFKLLQFAAKLGHVGAMSELGMSDSSRISVSERAGFLCRTAVYVGVGKRNPWRERLCRLLPSCNTHALLAKDPHVDFVVGRGLKRYFLAMFGDKIPPTECLRAIVFFKSQCEMATKAVITWMLVAKKLHVMPDLRRLIGKLVWEARSEGNYVQLTDAPICFMNFIGDGEIYQW